ncbi:MAG: hypothetical protein GX139_02235 [Armatimonadetes bacterium]|nr:hypothetical protein [Armatimonadota bacterium]
MTMQRVLLYALCAVLLVSGFAYADLAKKPLPFSNVQPWDYELGPIFEAASARYQVPLPLLLALGHFGSAFENRGDSPTIEGGYGVMALRQNDMGGNSLAEAAALTGVSEEDLKTNAELNIMGAAAVLDAYAKQLQVDRTAGVDAWLDVIIKYAAIDKIDEDNPVPVFNRMFAMEVYQKLQAGVDTTNSMGETFNASAQNIGSIDLASLEPPGMKANVTGYSGATWYPAATCNYSAVSTNKSVFVVHTIEGTASGCLGWFRNCAAETSCHYVASEAGGIWQCVDEWHRAWHVGCANNYSIGCEHEGYAASASHPKTMYDASALLARDVCNRWGIPKTHNPCQHSILGHVDVNNCWCGPGHWDPGAGWDWTYYINAVNGTTYVNPPYLFGSGAEGWTAGNSVWSNGLVHTGSDWRGSIYFDQTGPDCYIYSPETNFTGSSPQVLNVDFYPQAGTGTDHDMQLHWRTAAEGSFSADKASPLTGYQGQNTWRTVNLSINSSKWTGQTIKQLRLDFDNNNQSTRYIVNHVVLQNALIWPFNSDVNGWTAGHSLTETWHTAGGWPGCLVTDQTGNDAYIYSPTLSGAGLPYNYIGGVNDWVKVRVYPQNSSGTAHDLRVYWIYDGDGAWNDTKSVPVTYTGKNGWVDVYVPVGQSTYWEGKHMTRLRVDFDEVSQGTRWIVDEISIVQLGKDSTAPTVPTGLNATAVSGSIVDLSWTASTDATGVNGYKIFRNGTQIATSISPSYRDTSCQAQTTYSYTVSAYDSVGNNSAQSAAKSVTTLAPDNQPPTVPANLRVTGTTTSSISLAWNASTDNIGVVGYRIYRNGAQVGTATGTTYNDTGLAQYSTHTYEVDAYDATPNYSAKSASVLGTTVALVFQDGFANLNNWVLDPVAGNNVMPTLSTAQNHGSISGANSLYFSDDAPHWVYHDFSDELTSGGYRAGILSGWMYDNAVSNMRIALRAYMYDAAGNATGMYWIGVTNGNPPNIPLKYMAAVYNSGWQYFDLGDRTEGWHRFAIEVLPYTGSNDLKFYIDGALKLTTNQPPTAASSTLKRTYLGYNYTPNQPTYWDDIVLESVPPLAPTGVSGTALSTSAIRWNFTDKANNEIGHRVYNGATKVAQREEFDINFVDETGLAANTTYNRTVKAYAGILESHAAAGSGVTLSVPPSVSNVTCDKDTNTWYADGNFTFTAVGGFGAGKVDHYQFAWTKQATHTWAGSEASWSSGTLVQTATSTGGWYLHLRGFNSANVANGTLDPGPFNFDSDSVAPQINSVSVTPSMVASGDAVHVTVDATDNIGVTSVKANGVSLTNSGGNIWTGDVAALGGLGIHEVNIVAEDAAGNTATDSSGSYLTALIRGASNKAALGVEMNAACAIYLFKFWGRVAEVDDNTFTLDDGSGSPITVNASGYKSVISTGDYAAARGMLSISGSDRAIQSEVSWITKF